MPNTTWRKWKIRQRLNELQGNEEYPEHRSVPEVQNGFEPGVDGIPLDDDYYRLVRSPGDVVISGPLGEFGKGKPGRWFESPGDAMLWAQGKYGLDRVTLIYKEGAHRWAVIVRNLRQG